LTQINSTEQLILQHLHTSGMKKNKENLLLTEFSSLKRLRKQLFSRYSAQILALRSKTEHLQNESNERQQELIRSQKRSSEKAQEKVERLHVHYLEKLRDEKETLAAKYSSALAVLEKKFETISQSQSLAAAAIAEATAQQQSNPNEMSELREQIQRMEKKSDVVAQR
jgi:hypothetical protein